MKDALAALQPTPSGEPETELDIDPDLPPVSVAGLDAFVYTLTDDTTKVTLTVKAQEASEAGAKAIRNALGNGQKATYLEITVEKTDSRGVVTEVHETGTIIRLEMSFDGTGRTNIGVKRYHNGEVQTLLPNPGDGEEGFIYDAAQKRIIIFTAHFSAYAIVYEETAPVPPEPIIPAYPVLAPETTENGRLSVAYRYAYAGQNVTFTLTPDEGFMAETPTVTDGAGNEIEVIGLENGKFSFVMPASSATLGVSFRAAGGDGPAVPECPKDETCPIAKFSDTDVNTWWHDGIHYCVENGLMKGVTDTLFDPEGDTSRAMIVTILYRLEGEPELMTDNIFEDVADGSWYEKAVVWAQGAGIVTGYGNGNFGPDDPITREQLATILYRYAQYKGQSFTGDWMFLLDFTDRADVSSWADEAVHWCSMKGIVDGKEGKVFDPQGSAIRAEAATMIQRFCETMEK